MKRTRTCGASCYNAIEPACDCICGGTFHGQAGEVNRKRIQAMTGGALPKNAGQMLVLQAAIRRLHEVKRLATIDRKMIGS